MQRLFRRHSNCWQCKLPIMSGHVDDKFCSPACGKKFYNDLNNATTSFRKKLLPPRELYGGAKSKAFINAMEQNEAALRRVVHAFDFDFKPVPRLLLEAWGYDFSRYTSTEINPQTDGRIYWTYAIGVEVGSDPEPVTIHFRSSNGRLRHMNT